MTTIVHMPFTMGMGRAAREYGNLLTSKDVSYINWYDILQNKCHVEPNDVLFMFVVPQPRFMEAIRQLVKLHKKSYGMTVWETDQPPECFKEYATLFDQMFAPSMFSARMFDPVLTFLPHHVRKPGYDFTKVNTGLVRILATPGYKFYSISDFTDRRKNISQLVKGFLECGFPGAKLVLKHNREAPREANHPNIINIIGELTDTDMMFIHDACHCYVNLSFSEGVGLGILEAALWDKPIIMTDYGGQNDYVDTSFKVKTTKGPIGFDEFLFTKDMTWGHPDHEDYKRILKEVYLDSPKNMDHPKTKKLVSARFIMNILKRYGL